MAKQGAPKVTVCIANYNGMAVIDACLQSVIGQDCNFAVEIIVHDDASTDKSAEYIRLAYPFVTLIKSTENVGFCLANNRMAEMGSGEFLLLLNNDAALFPDALRTLFDSAYEIGQPAILGLPQYSTATGDLIDIGSTLDFFLNPIPNLDIHAREAGMIIGACLWIPKELWKNLGGFPTWFGSLAEDMYLCCLARLRGHVVRALPTSGFKHCVGHSFGGGKISANRLASTFKRRAMSERNKTFVMTLCYPAPFIQLLLPLHVFLLLAEGLVLAAIKRDALVFHSIYLNIPKTLWKERQQILQARKAIQGTRCISASAFFSGFRLLPHKFRLLAKHGIPEIH